MANATVVTLNSAITSPIPGSPVIRAPGIIIFSDSFARSGLVVGSTSDSYRGGVQRQWAGTAGSMNTLTQYTYPGLGIVFNGGARSNGTTFISNCVNLGAPDMSISFRVANPPTNPTLGYNTLVDFRKEAADIGSCYRLVFYTPAGLPTGGFAFRLAKRIGTVGSFITNADTTAIVGDTIKVELLGSNIKVYVNDVIKIDVIDTDISTGNFYGFAASSTSNTNAITYADYVARTI